MNKALLELVDRWQVLMAVQIEITKMATSSPAEKAVARIKIKVYSSCIDDLKKTVRKSGERGGMNGNCNAAN